MGEHWVCKSDGRIQCQDEPETSLDEMRKQLATIIGDENIIDQRKISVQVIQLCGMPAGTFNAYLLTEAGYILLKTGIVGPIGFSDCPGDGKPMVESADGSDQPSLAAAILTSGIGSAHANPVLVRELIGTQVRIYEQGTAITLDFRPGRTNIVTKGHMIADIWFG